MERSKVSKVYYHKNCVDGFGSAFAFWLINPHWNYQSIQYGEEHLIPEVQNYIDEPEEHYQGLYFLDFCPKTETLVALANKKIKPVVLDHHKTQKEIFDKAYSSGLISGTFDTSKSGAMLAYEYATIKLNKSPMQRQWLDITLFEMIQDRDLWLFKNKDSKALHAWLICNMDFDYFLHAYTNLESVIEIGNDLLKQTNSIVEKCCKSVYFQNYMPSGAFDIPTVNSPIHQSEICDLLLKQFPNHPVSACEYQDGAEKWVVSLRSRKDYDCSVIAKLYGGGGHAQACGFILRNKEALKGWHNKLT